MRNIDRFFSFKIQYLLLDDFSWEKLLIENNAVDEMITNISSSIWNQTLLYIVMKLINQENQFPI